MKIVFVLYFMAVFVNCSNPFKVSSQSVSPDKSSVGSSYDPTYTVPSTIPGNAIYVDNDYSGTENGQLATPFNTVDEALDIAVPGDTVVLREGIYLLDTEISIPGGDSENPLTLMGYPGEKPVLSLMRNVSSLTTWTSEGGGIYSAILPFKPASVHLGYVKQTISKYPKDGEGWFVVDHAEGPASIPGIATLEDSDLTTFPYDITSNGNAEAYIWCQYGNSLYTVAVESLNTSSGVLTVTQTSINMILGYSEDKGFYEKYWLQNHKNMITNAGEWAVAESGGQYILYYKPANVADLSNINVVQTNSARVINISNAENVILANLHITGADGHGIYIYRSQNITIAKCVIHNNNSNGIFARNSSNVIIAKNIIHKNKYGTGFYETTNGLFENNDVGYCGVDGINITYDSKNVTARRNYFHHNLLWGHPDQIQLFINLHNISINENLTIGAGQSIMAEEVFSAEIRGNTFIGAGSGFQVILGSDYSGSYLISNNTIVYQIFGCFNFNEQRDHYYTVTDNILMTGHKSIRALGIDETLIDYKGDRNLFFSALGADDLVLASSTDGTQTLQEFQEDVGQELNSAFGDPLFVNAPVYYNAVDISKLHLCTKSRLYPIVKYGFNDMFSVGDYIEVNHDGIPRQITEVNTTGEYITFTPALDYIPYRMMNIFNWKTNNNFKLDFTLSAGSPAKNMSVLNGSIGSIINIQNYIDGDFNNDSIRDIPDVPADI